MKNRILPTLCALLALGLLGTSLYFFWRSAQGPQLPPQPTVTVSTSPTPSKAPTPAPVPTPSAIPTATSPAIEADNLPHDKLFITPKRQGYTDGALQLIIPKLEVDVAILNGVSADTLLRGEGLYDYAQLPSEPAANTSIAGHRNWIRQGKITLDQAFSYLDTLEEGDYIYLRDSEQIYRYAFAYQEVIKPDNWGPIYKTDQACITLTTCTPIGVSDHRLVVRGAWEETLPYTEDYAYPSNNKGG